MENRYDKYKDSGVAWIGEIPEHWEVIKIKNAFNIISGATPKTDNMAYWDGEITWITPADYNTEDKIISSGKRNITLAGLNSCGTSIVPEGSIIFSKRAPIGLVAINVVPLCTNQGCISCIPKPSVNTKYFYYLMSVLTEWFELFGSGTTFKELSTNNFANFILSQPLILEQQSIAAYLDQKCGEIDELITLQEEMITKLQSYKQSVITEAVTKGLDKNVPLRDSGIEWIGEIPKHWVVKRLKYVCDFNPQNDQSISKLSEVGYLPMERLKNGYMLPSVISVSNLTQGLTFFKKNDIVLAKVTPCFENGNIAIAKNLVNNCGFGSSELFVFRVKSINRKYLFYLLQEGKIKDVCKSTMIGTGGLKRISPIFMKNIQLPIPSLSEQQAIADYLDQKCSEIDELISIKQQKIEKLKEYKKSLIFECVTGKRKVS